MVRIEIEEEIQKFEKLKGVYERFKKKGFPRTFGDFLVECAYRGMRDMMEQVMRIKTAEKASKP